VDVTRSAGPPERSQGRVWRFADCEFDERGRELRVRGVVVDLEVKPLGVLQMLLLHAGEVVTKAELLEAVWPGVLVVDGSLATAISKLRKALAADEAVIATVPRVGYKLAAPVHCASPAGQPRQELRLEPGHSVPGRGQWRLVRRIESSSWNDVWLADHPKTRDLRVFKFAADDERLRGLKREVTVARLLRDALGERRDFVRMFEWNFDVRPYFIESEYVGPNLMQWAEAQGGLPSVPWKRRLELLTEVASAVAAAHALDVLHKDLKPGNILIGTTPEGAPQVKVADFGSASLLVPERLAELGITNLGFTRAAADDLHGTVMYVAPEVLAGQTPTAAADVYALGVLLYQMAVGDFRRPFAPGWDAGITDKLICEDIAAAAAGEPAHRVESASELAHRLANLDGRRQAEEEAHRRRQAAAVRQARAVVLRRWITFGTIATAAAALVAILASRQDLAPFTPAPRTVAVLPFQNVDADPAFDSLRLALPDGIAAILGRAHGVAVRPFSTTSGYDLANSDIHNAGLALGADTLVTGRFRKVQDQLQITLEAVDATANALLWRETIATPARSMVASHVQLGLRVRTGLVPALRASVSGAIPEPQNDAAYEFYLRTSTLPYDPGFNSQAIAMLQRAVELDPAYAPAWLSLARRHYVEAHFGSGDSALMDRAAAAGERAVALDPDDVSAAGAVTVIDVERGDLARAHARAEDLVRRRSDDGSAQFVMSYVLRYAGLLEESASHCERALLVDPQPLNTTLRPQLISRSWMSRSCSLVFFVRGDFTRAQNYLNLDRQSEVGKAYWVDLLVRQGKTTAALDIGLPKVPQYLSKYEMLFACIQGKPAAELSVMARRIQPSADPEENYLSAAHLSYCGQIDTAAAMLTRAIEGNYCSFPAMESDPLFANLRTQPQYADIRAAGVRCQQQFLAERTRPAR
jgi:DNA-binding winged helix-turn-helix (wHTH) protein/serine/threonine protein kinase